MCLAFKQWQYNDPYILSIFTQYNFYCITVGGYKFWTIVWNIYYNYKNTILDGHIVYNFLGCPLTIFSHTGQELLWSYYIFWSSNLSCLHYHHKLFYGSVLKCLFWRPGNELIQTVFLVLFLFICIGVRCFFSTMFSFFSSNFGFFNLKCDFFLFSFFNLDICICCNVWLLFGFNSGLFKKGFSFLENWEVLMFFFGTSLSRWQM